jgi:hypothetical protein
VDPSVQPLEIGWMTVNDRQPPVSLDSVEIRPAAEISPISSRTFPWDIKLLKNMIK